MQYNNSGECLYACVNNDCGDYPEFSNDELEIDVCTKIDELRWCRYIYTKYLFVRLYRTTFSLYEITVCESV